MVQTGAVPALSWRVSNRRFYADRSNADFQRSNSWRPRRGEKKGGLGFGRIRFLRHAALAANFDFLPACRSS